MSRTNVSARQRNRTVLKKALKLAQPEISKRVRDVSQKIQKLLSRKTLQKIHLKIDLNNVGSSAIELSSTGLIASEYGRQQTDGNGIVSQALSEVDLASSGAKDDE